MLVAERGLWTGCYRKRWNRAAKNKTAPPPPDPRRQQAIRRRPTKTRSRSTSITSSMQCLRFLQNRAINTIADAVLCTVCMYPAQYVTRYTPNDERERDAKKKKVNRAGSHLLHSAVPLLPTPRSRESPLHVLLWPCQLRLTLELNDASSTNEHTHAAAIIKAAKNRKPRDEARNKISHVSRGFFEERGAGSTADSAATNEDGAHPPTTVTVVAQSTPCDQHRGHALLNKAKQKQPEHHFHFEKKEKRNVQPTIRTVNNKIPTTKDATCISIIHTIVLRYSKRKGINKIFKDTSPHK